MCQGLPDITLFRKVIIKVSENHVKHLSHLFSSVTVAMVLFSEQGFSFRL